MEQISSKELSSLNILLRVYVFCLMLNAPPSEIHLSLHDASYSMQRDFQLTLISELFLHELCRDPFALPLNDLCDGRFYLLLSVCDDSQFFNFSIPLV